MKSLTYSLFCIIVLLLCFQNCKKDGKEKSSSCFEILAPAANTSVPYDTSYFEWDICGSNSSHLMLALAPAFDSVVLDTTVSGQSVTVYHYLRPDTVYYGRIVNDNDTLPFVFRTTSILDNIAGIYEGRYYCYSTTRGYFSRLGTLTVIRVGSNFISVVTDSSSLSLLDTIQWDFPGSLGIHTDSPFPNYASFSGFAPCGSVDPAPVYYYYESDSIDMWSDCRTGSQKEKEEDFSGKKKL